MMTEQMDTIVFFLNSYLLKFRKFIYYFTIYDLLFIYDFII